MFKKVVLMAAALSLAACAYGAGGPAAERELDINNVLTTYYALGNDVTAQKAFSEGVYITSGERKEALNRLRDIIFEGKKPATSFRMKDKLNIIVFRGTFLKQSKVTVKKVVLKGAALEVYAEYADFNDSDFPCQPAAVIPVGSLPPGKYSVMLFVGGKVRTISDFNVSK